MSKARPDIRSVISPKGIKDKFVCFSCPEDFCDWDTGDWIEKYQGEALLNYQAHWREAHTSPPEPHYEEWTG